MVSKAVIMFLVLSLLVPVGAVQTTPTMGSQAATSQANTAGAAENAQLRQLAHHDEAQALRDDIRKMRALVRQMETNLAFVDTTQSPLKHQFQMEIDLWKTLIDQMERRAQNNSR